jgi:hypothetical protein
MKATILFRLRRLLKDEHGSVMPILALMLTSMVAIAGLTLDAGHAYFTFRELQTSTNAAALAGAKQLPNTTATSVAIQYSSLAGDLNVKSGLSGVTMVSGYPMLKCLTSLSNEGMPCLSPSNANAIQVKQTLALPLYFSRLLGEKTVTLTASATAAMRGGSPTQYNVAIVMDTTLSMNVYDSDCGTTEMQCELNGVQTLLQTLTPCITSGSSCTFTNGVATNSVDRVSLFAFPNVTTDTVGIDTNCTVQIPNNWQYYNSAYGGPYDEMSVVSNLLHGKTTDGLSANPYSGVPTAWPYSNPSATATSYTSTSEGLIYNIAGLSATLATDTVTYQITPYLSDYRTSGTATTLNANSNIVQAVGGASNCGSILPPNFDGNFGTYYAGALYAAQSSLVAQKAANPGSQNVIILLSDGNANIPSIFNSIETMPGGLTATNGNYPSSIGECGQGITAAKAAATAGTRVYTVAYGALNYSSSAACPTDVGAGNYPNVTPCSAMQQMASSSQYFFSDYNQSGSGSTCTISSQPLTKLNDIFSAIANDLTVSRLIPDGTT